MGPLSHPVLFLSLTTEDPYDVESIMVTACSMFPSLTCNSTRACDAARVLFSLDNIELCSHSISYPAKVLPGVILLYSSLLHKCIFLGIILLGETVSVSYT